MDAIAKRAGVQRATVYNHFPTELELFDACSSHWFVENPPPDPADWQKVDDPAERTEKALKEMYDYFDRGKEMLGKVLRDAPVVPAMGSIRDQKWTPMLEGMVEILANGWTGSQSRIRASLRVALDFFTWESLADSGLSDEAAAMLAAGWIRSSV
jgi:AcrR family transcriptional regulator